jgi:hypothetical protein
VVHAVSVSSTTTRPPAPQLGQGPFHLWPARGGSPTAPVATTLPGAPPGRWLVLAAARPPPPNSPDTWLPRIGSSQSSGPGRTAASPMEGCPRHVGPHHPSVAPSPTRHSSEAASWMWPSRPGPPPGC